VTAGADKAIAVSLDGYTDLPPGKVANVVTFFEMTAPPADPGHTPPDGLAVRTVADPSPAWYRDLYRRIGEEWLWFSRAVMPETELAALLADPATEILAAEDSLGTAVGLAELHYALGEVEIAMFGVVPALTGNGTARWLMQEALRRAWSAGVGRVWLHTCTFDHPAAVRFYKRVGFVPFKFAIEIADDPRLTGQMPETAGPHIALIRGSERRS
jgi:GNAT superfamily N-acetyltransferase